MFSTNYGDVENSLDITSDGLGSCISLFLLKTVLKTAVKGVSQTGPQGPPGVIEEVQGGPLPEHLCLSTMLRNTMGSGDWKCQYIPVMTSLGGDY